MKTVFNQSISVVIIILLAFSSMGCKKDTDTICENLLEQGTGDTSLLNGEWQLEYFARTRNGKKIKYKEKNEIAVTITFNEDTAVGTIRITNTMGFSYMIESKNYINIDVRGSTFIQPPPEEAELENRVSSALENVSCYAIKNSDTLFLFYKSKDDDKNLMQFSKK